MKSLSRVPLFATSWTAARLASLSFTISQSLLKLTSIESNMPSNHLILCHPLHSGPQSFAASGSFTISWFFASSGRSIGASASVFPTNIQGWFLLRLVCSPCCPRDSQESSPAPQFESISSSVLSLLYGPTRTCVHDSWKAWIVCRLICQLHHLQILSPILWVVFSLVYDILCCTKACKFNEVSCAYFCFYFHYT